MMETWAIINYEQAIVQYQLELQKLRDDWDIPRGTMVWAFLNKDGNINWRNFGILEVIILIVGSYVFWTSRWLFVVSSS